MRALICGANRGIGIILGSLNHFDGQEVIYKNNANQIQNDCTASIADRADWFEKIVMTLSDDGSGIRWIVIDQTLPCIIDNENLSFDTHPSFV